MWLPNTILRSWKKNIRIEKIITDCASSCGVNGRLGRYVWFCLFAQIQNRWNCTGMPYSLATSSCKTPQIKMGKAKCCHLCSRHPVHLNWWKKYFRCYSDFLRRSPLNREGGGWLDQVDRTLGIVRMDEGKNQYGLWRWGGNFSTAYPPTPH